MSAQPVEILDAVPAIDPNSDFGQRVTDGLARLNAAVVERLRNEGRPIPGQPADPAP